MSPSSYGCAAHAQVVHESVRSRDRSLTNAELKDRDSTHQDSRQHTSHSSAAAYCCDHTLRSIWAEWRTTDALG